MSAPGMDLVSDVFLRARQIEDRHTRRVFASRSRQRKEKGKETTKMMVGFLVDSRKVVSRDTASLAIDLSWVLWHERQQLLVLCGVAIPPTRELGDWWGRASRLTVWSAFSSDLGTVSVNLFLGSALWGRNPMADPHGRAL